MQLNELKAAAPPSKWATEPHNYIREGWPGGGSWKRVDCVVGVLDERVNELELTFGIEQKQRNRAHVQSNWDKQIGVPIWPPESANSRKLLNLSTFQITNRSLSMYQISHKYPFDTGLHVRIFFKFQKQKKDIENCTFVRDQPMRFVKTKRSTLFWKETSEVRRPCLAYWKWKENTTWIYQRDVYVMRNGTYKFRTFERDLWYNVCQTISNRWSEGLENANLRRILAAYGDQFGFCSWAS